MAGTPAHVSFAKTNKRVNSTAEVVMGETLNCFLKNPVSLMRPELLVHLEHNSPGYEDVFHWNYMYIEEFGRYYFITDIISETSKLVTIIGEIDALGTYREDILNTKAFIQYSAAKNNSMLHDNRIHVGRNGKMHVTQSEKLFEETPIIGCWCITIGSQNGASKVGVFNNIDMINLGNALWGSTGVDMLKTNQLNPLALISSCIWLPLSKEEVMSGNTFDFKVADETFLSGISEAKHAVEIQRDKDLSFMIPYRFYNEETKENTYGTYLNIEPYTQLKCMLPGVGIVQLPLEQIIGDAKEADYNIKILANLSPATGEIMYEVYKSDNIGYVGFTAYDLPLITAHGSIGTQVPLSSSAANMAGALSSGLHTVISTGVNALSASITGNPFFAAQAAGSLASGLSETVLQTNSVQNTVSGYMGGYESAHFNMYIVYILEYYVPSDFASNYKESIGTPYFKADIIKNHMGGVIKCTGAWVESEGATKEEQQMIAQLVNSSANFIYGGLIVE